jgi:hypothetical protein
VFGYDSPPKLNSANQAVRDLIWAGGQRDRALLAGAGRDGWRLTSAATSIRHDQDPNNNYWKASGRAPDQT